MSSDFIIAFSQEKLGGKRKSFQSNYISLWQASLESVDLARAELEAPSLLIKLLAWTLCALAAFSLRVAPCGLGVWGSCLKNCPDHRAT